MKHAMAVCGNMLVVAGARTEVTSEFVGLLAAELTSVVLGQPELKQVGGQVVVPGRIAAADDAAADFLA
jgi:hypothetical protein